jgi:hypothetical protein
MSEKTVISTALPLAIILSSLLAGCAQYLSVTIQPQKGGRIRASRPHAEWWRQEPCSSIII